MVTTIPQFTLPVPQRSDPANFAARADTLVSELPAFVTAANAAGSDMEAVAAAAAASALTATNAPGTSGTSTSSVAVGTGSKTFTTQSGKNFVPGMWVTIARTSAPSNYMVGYITGYSGTTLTVLSVITNGSGTFTDWTIAISPPLVTPVATVADIWAGTSNTLAITPSGLFQAVAFQSLTDAATITPDFNAGINFKVTLGGNRTFANPTNIKEGQAGEIAMIQDGTGSRVPTYGSYYKFANSSVPLLSTTAGSIDIFSYEAISATQVLMTLTKRFG